MIRGSLRAIETVLELRQQAACRTLHVAGERVQDALTEAEHADTSLESALTAHRRALNTGFDPAVVSSWAGQALSCAAEATAAAVGVRAAIRMHAQEKGALALAQARSAAAQTRRKAAERSARAAAWARSDDEAADRFRVTRGGQQ